MPRDCFTVEQGSRHATDHDFNALRSCARPANPDAKRARSAMQIKRLGLDAPAALDASRCSLSYGRGLPQSASQRRTRATMHAIGRVMTTTSSKRYSCCFWRCLCFSLHPPYLMIAERPRQERSRRLPKLRRSTTHGRGRPNCGQSRFHPCLQRGGLLLIAHARPHVRHCS